MNDCRLGVETPANRARLVSIFPGAVPVEAALRERAVPVERAEEGDRPQSAWIPAAATYSVRYALEIVMAGDLQHLAAFLVQGPNPT